MDQFFNNISEDEMVSLLHANAVELMSFHEPKDGHDADQYEAFMEGPSANDLETTHLKRFNRLYKAVQIDVATEGTALVFAYLDVPSYKFVVANKSSNTECLSHDAIAFGFQRIKSGKAWVLYEQGIRRFLSNVVDTEQGRNDFFASPDISIVRAGWENALVSYTRLKFAVSTKQLTLILHDMNWQGPLERGFRENASFCRCEHEAASPTTSAPARIESLSDEEPPLIEQAESPPSNTSFLLEQVECLRQANASLKEKLDETEDRAEKSVESLRLANASLGEKLEEAEDSAEKKQFKLRQARQECADYRKENQGLKKSMNSLEKNISSLQHRLIILENERKKTKNLNSRNSAVR